MKPYIRRDFLVGIGAACASCFCSSVRAQWPRATSSSSTTSGSTRPGWGEFKRNGCTFSGAQIGVNGVPQISIYSGRQDVDTAYQREGERLARVFQVRPAGGFMNDAGSPNAFATTDRFFTNSYDGTIIFGVSLIAEELQRDFGQGISVPAIMAHEFAHIFQFKEGSLRSVSTSVRELQADFLAGWYMRQIGLSENQMRPAMESFFNKGDYTFNSPNHHGTPRERLGALINGYKNSSDSIQAAFNAGKSHVGV